LRRISWPYPKQASPGISLRINDLQGPKSLTHVLYIDKKDEEAKKLRSRAHWQEMKLDHDLTIHQHVQAGSQQKEKDSISETQIQARHFIKEKYLQRVQAP
jgi:hypothetical protein